MKKDNESADEGKGNKAQEDRALATGTGLTKKWRTVLVVAATLVAFVFVLTQFVLPTIVPKRGRTITKSELTKAVAVDRLDTAEMTYEGVFDHAGGFANIGEYHVAYKATITACIKMSDIDFDINNKEKTVTITLPAVSIRDPVIDADSLSYLPSDPGVDMQEIIANCKKDASEEANSNTQIKETAIHNAKTAIRALTDSLLDDIGYRIEWRDEFDSNKTNADQTRGEKSAGKVAQNDGLEGKGGSNGGN